MELEEWERHVIKDIDYDNVDWSKAESWCGVKLWRHDMPVALDVAKIMIRDNHCKQPCEACMRAAKNG